MTVSTLGIRCARWEQENFKEVVRKKVKFAPTVSCQKYFIAEPSSQLALEDHTEILVRNEGGRNSLRTYVPINRKEEEIPAENPLELLVCNFLKMRIERIEEIISECLPQYRIALLSPEDKVALRQAVKTDKFPRLEILTALTQDEANFYLDSLYYQNIEKNRWFNLFTSGEDGRPKFYRMRESKFENIVGNLDEHTKKRSLLKDLQDKGVSQKSSGEEIYPADFNERLHPEFVYKNFNYMELFEHCQKLSKREVGDLLRELRRINLESNWKELLAPGGDGRPGFYEMEESRLVQIVSELGELRLSEREELQNCLGALKESDVLGKEFNPEEFREYSRQLSQERILMHFRHFRNENEEVIAAPAAVRSVPSPKLTS